MIAQHSQQMVKIVHVVVIVADVTVVIVRTVLKMMQRTMMQLSQLKAVLI